MKRVLLAAALCVFVLTGCESLRRCFGMPTPDKPSVAIVDGLPTVDPEPLAFDGSQRNVVIIWRLEDPALRFVPDTGIRIDGEVQRPGDRPNPQQAEVVDCRVVGDGRQFMCLNKNTRAGTYKYTVRVRLADGRIVEKDPFIVNSR